MKYKYVVNCISKDDKSSFIQFKISREEYNKIERVMNYICKLKIYSLDITYKDNIIFNIRKEKWDT